MATSACAAIDNNADVIASSDPTAGSGAWWFKNVIPYTSPQDFEDGVIETNGTFAISCPGTNLCVGVGQEFKILTSSNPFERDLVVGAKRGSSKRPRVVITRHPAKRVEAKKGGTKVRFKFRAIGEAARFKCKLIGKRYRPCTSPVVYTVPGGKHIFRVRAIAPGGLKGPPTALHFRVGALTERPPPGSCPPGSEGDSIGKPCI